MFYFFLSDQVKLKESLLAMLKFCKVKNDELAWVDAEVAAPEEDSDLRRGDEATEELMALQPVQDQKQRPRHNPLFISDFKLSDFRQVRTEQCLGNHSHKSIETSKKRTSSQCLTPVVPSVVFVFAYFYLT